MVPQRRTVLLVDDDPLVLALGRRALKRLGVEVLTAANGLEALDHFAERRGDIQVVVTDVDMPHMTGLQLIAAIRELGVESRFVLMSGSGPEEALRAAEQAGLMFVPKPWSPQALVEVVRQALAHAPGGSGDA